MNNYSRLVLAATFTTCVCLYAQSASTVVDEARHAYDHVKDNILKAAEEMPEQDYSFQPTPDIRTFGQLVGHIAEAQAHYCSAAAGTSTQFSAKGKTSKADLVAALKESSDLCDKAYDSVNESNFSTTAGTGRMQHSKLGILYGNIVHDNEEYGYMAVYLRLKGQIPPSSQAHAMPVSH